MGIKLAHLLGKLFLGIIRMLSGFFRFLLGTIFYKILVKIYYTFFRLRKNDLAAKTLRELINNKLVYIFLLGLTLSLMIINLSSHAQAGAPNVRLSRTLMANLISDDLIFRAPEEELIEETMNPASLLALVREKYTEDQDILHKNFLSFTRETNNNTQEFPELLSSSGDVLLKPSLAGIQESGASEPMAAQRTEIVYYEVRPGDTVSSIAQRFNISINTILWANNLTARSLIRPGNRLTILPYSGVLYTVKSGDTLSRIASLYSIDMDKIATANNLVGGLKAGETIVLPGANRLVAPQIVSRPASGVSGITAIRDLIQAPAARVSGEKMNWPTVGSRITQYFSWRHNGVDIANKTGTPIYAADDGVVELAATGYNGGYGNTIVINHGGGLKTRYAHASQLFVKVGDRVEKGENIASMGSTGRSTGPHLHFEVLINGARKNPLDYIR